MDRLLEHVWVRARHAWRTALCAALPLGAAACPAPLVVSGGDDAGLPMRRDAGVEDTVVYADAGSEERAMRIRKLVALGSSSTAGAGASSPEQGYAALMAAAFDAQLVNLGAGGQRITDVEGTRLSAALAALDPQPPAGQRDVVSFLPFSDYVSGQPESVSAGYDRVLTALAPTGASVAFGLLVLPDTYVCGRGSERGPDGLCYDDALAADLDAMEDAMRAMLARHPQVFVVEVAAQSVQHPEWDAPDGHPNDRGHRYLAGLFVDAVAAQLALEVLTPVPAP